MTEDDKALVERLRDDDTDPVMLKKAADRIEALTAENERLREALAPFARAEHIVASVDGDRVRCILSYPSGAIETFTLASLDAARAALGETK